MARRAVRAALKQHEEVMHDTNLPALSPLGHAPGGVQFLDRSLVIPVGMELADWIELGKTLGTMERAVQWYIGDWWAFGEHSYGDRLEVVSAPGWVGPSFKTCANAASVCRAFETSRRRAVLPFTHHAEVAGLDRKLADKLLDRAERVALDNEGVPPPSRELRLQVKAQRREQRQIANDDESDDSKALGGRKYSVIYADPWAEDANLSIRKMADLVVPASKNAAIFLWRKAHLIAQAEALMDAWGFEPKAEFVWVKPRAAAEDDGPWNKPRHEVLMIGVRGHVSAPSTREQYESVVSAAPGKNHEKPVIFQEMIDDMFPNSRGLEMFTRGSGRPGWDTWESAGPIKG